ncbi:MAG: hypothetical protein WA708_11645 [Acidobacteriaceae bacterium]
MGQTRRTKIAGFRSAVALATVMAAVSILPRHTHAQQDSTKAFVQSIVDHELTMDANDHSRWMYRDADKVHGKSIVKLVVQTPEGSVSKMIEIDGHPLTPQEEREDEQRMHRFVMDAALRQKQKQSNQHDDKQAASLTKMLPDAFLWTKIGESGDQTTLSFEPNPKFKPPTREARVFSAMKGTMVVNTTDRRIQSLKGELIRNVEFGWGLLGKLDKGGTFNVERKQIDSSVWQITGTHVHIQGHALIFKSISEQQDEETSDYKPAPESITLAEAEKMLNDGTVAKDLGIEQTP